MNRFFVPILSFAIVGALFSAALATFDSPYVQIPGLGSEPFRGNGSGAAWFLAGACLISAGMILKRYWLISLIASSVGLAIFAKFTLDRIRDNRELLEAAKEFDPAMAATYANVAAGWGGYLIVVSLVGASLFALTHLLVARKG